MPTSTRQWVLANKPTDLPILEGDQATFKLVTTDLPPLQDNQVLLKTLFLSNDPAQRGWISANRDPERLYVPPVQVNERMRAYGIAEVIESKSEKLLKGKLVTATVGWGEYAVLDAQQCTPIQEIEGVDVTHFLGAFGGTGMTAYYGINDIARTSKDDAVVVSGAAGATGSMVVQISKKMIGCKKVIGIAGSDEKCRWVESLGADVCLNYKSPSFVEDLKKATEGFVEVYFDNVGGEILDLMLTRMKRHGRITACGAIADYNRSEGTGIKNWFEIISNRLEIKGFIVFDAVKGGKAPQMIKTLVQAYKEGKLKIGDENQMVVETPFEDIPKTWMKLFHGGNTGKLVTKLI